METAKTEEKPVQDIKPAEKDLKDDASVDQPSDTSIKMDEPKETDAHLKKNIVDSKKPASEIRLPATECDTKSVTSAPASPGDAPTSRRLNKLRDHSSTVFPAGCMGCPEEPSEHILSPRRFLDAMEAKEHAGLIDNTPKKRPSSAQPAPFCRNPLTGAGMDADDSKRSGARRKDGNPLLGEGYECDAKPVVTNRVPPGGYSKGLW